MLALPPDERARALDTMLKLPSQRAAATLLVKETLATPGMELDQQGRIVPSSPRDFLKLATAAAAMKMSPQERQAWIMQQGGDQKTAALAGQLQELAKPVFAREGMFTGGAEVRDDEVVVKVDAALSRNDPIGTVPITASEKDAKQVAGAVLGQVGDMGKKAFEINHPTTPPAQKSALGGMEL